MERLRFIHAELHLMPFAVVLHVEVEVLAFGKDGFGVGGVALEAEFEDVGAGF